MKNIFFVFLLLPLTSFSATCIGGGNVYDDLFCAQQNLGELKNELNVIYRKIYSSTPYKDEFEKSQRAWLNYREKQCNNYIAAEASQSQGAGPGLIVKDCLVTITRQRVDYLKTLLVK